MQSRTNLIMSHGGRHGQGGTYLRGTKMDPKTSEMVPNQHLSGNSPEAWAGQGRAKTPTRARKATNEGEAAFSKGSPEAKALLDAQAKAEAEKAAPKPTTPPPAPAPTSGVDTFEEPEEGQVPDHPTSRRQLTLMRKSELIALADSVAVDSDGTADDIRARLTDYFFEGDDSEE